MKKVVTMVFLSVFLLFSFQAIAGNFTTTDMNTNTRALTDDDAPVIREILFEDDFESGENGWTTDDVTDVGEKWHVSDFMAFEGDSWWCGDEAFDGYDNHWLQFLDTPVLDLSTASNPALNFQANWFVEPPGGEPTGYDGWDTANIWISTDGGATFDPIEPTSGPAYNITSSYAFGEEWGMGEGIPGWGGDGGGWQAVGIDLADYATSEVVIRFAFCSDPAASTADGTGPDWHGFHVDNISVVDGETPLFTNDGADNGDMNAIAMGGEGDYWELSDQDSHSPSHAWHLPDGIPNLSNALVSPAIDLPSDADAITFRFWINCDQADFDGNDDSSLDDYYHVETSTNGGVTWTTEFYDYGDDTRPGGAGWAEYLPGMPFNGNIEMDLSDYAGETLHMRWRVTTDGNDDGGVATGLWIDDVVIEAISVPNIWPPCNLDAMYDAENDAVELTWEEPCPGPAEPWIHWDSGFNDDSIGLTDGGTFYVAARFEDADMAPYVGYELTQMKVWLADAAATYVIKVWEGGSSGDPGTEVLSQSLTAFNTDDWTTVDLDTPVEIMDGEEYWIGYEITHNAGTFPAGVDAGPMVAFKGGWLSTDGTSWIQLTDAGLDGNWNIQGHIPMDGGTAVIFNPDNQITLNEVNDYTAPDVDPGLFSANPNDNASPRDTEDLPESWNLYRSFSTTFPSDPYATIDDPNALSYIDEGNSNDFFPNIRYYYALTAVYAGGVESDTSNVVWIMAEPNAVEDNEETVAAFALKGNYPNPFNPSTTIAFSIPARENVELKVYNSTGQLVRTLLNEAREAGDHSITWDGMNNDGQPVASGVYHYTLRAGDYKDGNSMVLLK